MDTSINNDTVKEFAREGKVALSEIVGEEVMSELKDQIDETEHTIADAARRVVSGVSERSHEFAEASQKVFSASRDQVINIEERVVSYVKGHPVESLLLGAAACYAVKRLIQR